MGFCAVRDPVGRIRFRGDLGGLGIQMACMPKLGRLDAGAGRAGCEQVIEAPSDEDQVRSPRGGAGGLFTRRAGASGSSRPDASVAFARNTQRHNSPGRAAE